MLTGPRLRENDLVAFGAGERRVVDGEGHGKGRRIDGLSIYGLINGFVCKGVCHCGGLKTGVATISLACASSAGTGLDHGSPAATLVFQFITFSAQGLNGRVLFDHTDAIRPLVLIYGSSNVVASWNGHRGRPSALVHASR